MYAKDRRDFVEIEHEVSNSVNELNEPIKTWVKFTDCFCHIEARPGREKMDSDKVFSRSLFWFTTLIDEVDGVTTAMRINHEGKLYQIVNVRPDYRQRGDVIIEAVGFDQVV